MPYVKDSSYLVLIDVVEAEALYKCFIFAATQEAQVEEPTHRTVDPVSI